MLNMDFSERVVINTAQREWVASPMAGVWRKPLAREDAEGGHATSIVRYEPGSSFRAHNHPGGEEILVLEGTFSDATGDYEASTYFRNPIGFEHAPYSKEGCILLVKLHQFQADDEHHVIVDTLNTPFRPGQGALQVLPLHAHGTEQVALVRWPAGERFQPHTHFGGEEILVLSGELRDELGHYPAGTWLRSPHLSSHHPYVEEDTLIWVKVGHLPV
ncbi:MAG: cupin domain-containing protein [Pseudomonadota bacterium]